MQKQNTIFMALQEEEQTIKIILPAKFITECTYCGQEFIINRNEYLKRERLFQSKTYCSRECYNKNRPYRYNTHYYCYSCTCWIPQKEAKTNAGFYPTCPKIGCNNNRLRLSAAKAKFNHKRENVKRIE
jgi:hypothetical protein